MQPIQNQDAYPLLLQLLRRPDPGDQAPDLTSLRQAGWQRLLDQARNQGVSALLQRRLHSLDIHPPAEIADTLQQTSLFNAARNLLLYHELARLLPHFAAHAIPVIALKGLHLVELVYQDPSLRPMSDMDLLIPQHKLQTAWRQLLELGYQPPLLADPVKEARRHHHLPPLSHQNGGLVELHWNLVSPGSPQQVDLEGLWQRATPSLLDGAPARLLCPEDLLLHLCLHFCNHNFRLGLRHLYDLLATLEHYQDQVDWQALQTRGRQWNAHKCLFLSLHLAHTLLNAPLPGGFLDELRPTTFNPQLEQLARTRLYQPQPAGLHPDLAELWGAPSVTQKLRRAGRILFPPLDYMRAHYQAPPQPVRVYPYYLLRLWRLAKQYSGQVWQLLQRKSKLSAAAQQESSLTNWLQEK